MSPRPSLDDILDSVALGYYALLDLSPLHKLLLLAALVAAFVAYYALRERVERFTLALKYAAEEAKRQDPEMPPWWKGWHLDWRDAVDNVYTPWAEDRKLKRQQLAEALAAQAEAWATREAAEAELAARIESGTFVGADKLQQNGGSSSGAPGGAGSAR